MLTRAKIKLNAKRLYAADGYAVKELLKVGNRAMTVYDSVYDSVAASPKDLWSLRNERDERESRRIRTVVARRS